MTRFCLTPVKNEAWILDRFLRCASVWADHIILADQGSTDDTVTIARRFPKVKVVSNPSPHYDEAIRQKILLDTARSIPCEGPRVYFALDADEVLSADLWDGSREWDAVMSAAPGTVIMMQWANLLPGFASCWLMPKRDAFGFVDNGTPHQGLSIHSPRVPISAGGPVIALTSAKVVHYQFAATARKMSKQRWYQAWEALHSHGKRPVQIYRQYHNIDHVPDDEVVPLRDEWLCGYEHHGIEMRSIPGPHLNWWDLDIAEMVAEHGRERFRRIDIWDDAHWQHAGRKAYPGLPPNAFDDPRSAFDRFVFWWLARTQSRCQAWDVRSVQLALRLIGW